MMEDGLCLFLLTAAVCVLASRRHPYNSSRPPRQPRRHGAKSEDELSKSGYLQLIGNTPLIELHSLSRLTGCRVLAKVESANPGGSGKDRAAKHMILSALRRGSLRPHSDGVCHVVEGTSGSTGISLANIIRSLGDGQGVGGQRFQLHVVLPDDQAPEKRALLQKLGAEVVVVPTAAISNPQHYINVARRLAVSLGGLFVDQFENPANFEVHRRETGPELYRQVRRRLWAEAAEAAEAGDEEVAGEECRAIDVFVMSAGTGGTIAGIATALKATRNTVGSAADDSGEGEEEEEEEEDGKDADGAKVRAMADRAVHVVLADPNGSSLAARVTHGVCYTAQQQERHVRRHRYDTIVEGVGLDRLTANFSQGLPLIDAAVTVPDQEVVDVAHAVLRGEGLLLGSSSALNIAVACRVARERFGNLGAAGQEQRRRQYFRGRPTVVTVLCDSGTRHLSRFWNPEYLAAPPYCLKWPQGEGGGGGPEGAAAGTGAGASGKP